MPFPYCCVGTSELRRTMSTVNVQTGNNFMPIRESQSMTDGTPSFNRQSEQDFEDASRNTKVCYICTKQYDSVEPFWVYERMLTYQGKKYTEADIAPIWKKDCRMWLWKSKQKYCNKSK